MFKLFPSKIELTPFFGHQGVFFCLWGTFATTEDWENQLGSHKLVIGLFTPYHAIVFGIMLISGGASLWQMGDGNDFI